jgi:tetratricopeptide (TPR) repeat protein
VAHAVASVPPPTTAAAAPITAVPVPRGALDGATIDGMIDRGNFARNHGDLDLAARYYEDVLASDATNGRALAGLARVHQMRGDLPAATRVARELVEAHRDHPANHVLLADLLIAQGRNDEARTILEGVVRNFGRSEAARERLRTLEP